MFMHRNTKYYIRRTHGETYKTYREEHHKQRHRDEDIAHLRGQVVTAAQQYGVDHVVDWTTLRLTRPGAMPVQLLDPFTTESVEVDALLAEIRAAGTTVDPPLPA